MLILHGKTQKELNFEQNCHGLWEHDPLSIPLDGFWTRTLLYFDFSNKSYVHLCC